MITLFTITSIILAALLAPLSFGLLLSNMSNDKEDDELTNHLAEGRRISRYGVSLIASPYIVVACMLGLFQKELKDKSLAGFANVIGFLGYCLLISLISWWYLASKQGV